MLWHRLIRVPRSSRSKTRLLAFRFLFRSSDLALILARLSDACFLETLEEHRLKKNERARVPRCVLPLGLIPLSLHLFAARSLFLSFFLSYIYIPDRI